MTITEKINKLEQATDWFYSEDFSLDQAAEKYESAMKMAKEIQEEQN